MNGYKPLLFNLSARDIEPFIGIRGYASSTPGIGGVVKERLEDFKTWEILVTGEDARLLFESAGFWGGVGGEVLCVMRKRGIDTIRASTVIARKLGIHPSAVGVCGIKDKMSISWQFITLPASTLNPPQPIKFGETIQVKPIRYTISRLNSRILLKNLFEITVRHSVPNLHLIGETLSQLRERGLPNFFGHQRFGLTRPITHLVGRLIMEGRLEEAVSAFLADYSLLESPGNREAREKLLETWDLRWAAEEFPRSLRYEREVARYLTSNPGDYVGALRALPLRLRRLMVEAVAARLFNLTLSRLIKEDIFNVIEVGDLLTPLSIGGRAEKRRPIQVTGRNLGQAERLVKEGRAAVGLTVPGYLAPIPRSRKGMVLREVMEEEGVETWMFRVRSLPEASTRGSLRPIVVPRWNCLPRLEEDVILLHISLPPGSYATILLRELMKPENPLTFIGKTPNSG